MAALVGAPCFSREELDFSPAEKRFILSGMGFTGCGKTLFFEGYGLQPVRKRLKTGTTLAAEGRISIRPPTFSAASLALAYRGQR
jgi:hypothetical protein